MYFYGKQSQSAALRPLSFPLPDDCAEASLRTRSPKGPSLAQPRCSRRRFARALSGLPLTNDNDLKSCVQILCAVQKSSHSREISIKHAGKGVRQLLCSHEESLSPRQTRQSTKHIKHNTIATRGRIVGGSLCSQYQVGSVIRCEEIPACGFVSELIVRDADPLNGMIVAWSRVCAYIRK